MRGSNMTKPDRDAVASDTVCRGLVAEVDRCEVSAVGLQGPRVFYKVIPCHQLLQSHAIKSFTISEVYPRARWCLQQYQLRTVHIAKHLNINIINFL